MQLRDYQIKTIEMIKDEMKKGFKRIMVTLPTGAGKSIIMGHIAKKCLDKGSKVLALMHRRGLVEQLGDRFESCDVSSGTIMSQIEADLSQDIQIGTIQTFSRRLNFETIDYMSGDTIRPWRRTADVILLDEAHRSLSKTFQDAMKQYDGKIVIGFTATPSLSSGVSMGNYYETLIQPVQVKDLIEVGALVPGLYYGLSAPDLTGIRIVQGDYEKKSLEERVRVPKIIGDIVENWNRIANGKKTLVFAVNVKHSKAIVYEFNKFGITAEHLDAKSIDEKRNATLSRFRSGDTQILSNVDIFTEGTDIPEIECVCLARPTKSIGRYLQMVGRGARPYPSKSNFLVLDHGKNVNEHGFYEDPIDWSLEGKKISYTKPVPREPKEKHKMSCNICSAIFTGRICPECRTEVPDYGKKIEAIEADLKQLNESKKVKSKDKKSSLCNLKPTILVSMLISERDRLGKSDSWVRANYRNITERWPKSLDVRPIPATYELQSYLQYLRIKWIKSQKSRAA